MTWGATTKEFTAAQLAKGINLAAEFLDNPFVGQFNKVNEAVRTQEAQETVVSKIFMHNMPLFDMMATGCAGPAPAAHGGFGIAAARCALQEGRRLVVPITHTIKIEPES